MTNYLYSPAPHSAWTAIAGSGQLIVVDSKDPEVLTQLWAEAGKGTQAAVGVLTARGLAATPAFALVQWSETSDDGATARVIVRGAVEVAVTTETGVVKVSGAQVSTWSEHNFEGASACDVSAEASSDDCTMPLIAGVVSAQRVRLLPSGASASATASASSPAPAGRKAPTSTSIPHPNPLPVSEATIVDRPSSDVNLVNDSPLVAGSDEERIADSSVKAGINGDSSIDETLYRHIPDTQSLAKAEEPVTSAVQNVSDGEESGDHDGMTIMTGDLRKLRAERAAQSGNAAVIAEPLQAPSLFVDISTGGRERLTQPILVGRAPSVSKVSGGALPRLVTIPDDKDISRNHVQLAVEGGTVVVTDLHSRNGTYVVLPGKEAQRLRAGEPTAVIVGTIVDLGGDVTLTVGEEA